MPLSRSYQHGSDVFSRASRTFQDPLHILCYPSAREVIDTGPHLLGQIFAFEVHLSLLNEYKARLAGVPMDEGSLFTLSRCSASIKNVLVQYLSICCSICLPKLSNYVDQCVVSSLTDRG